MVTHNDNDFGNPDDRVRKNYATVLREITNAISAAGGEPTGATFASVADLVRGADTDKGNFVYAHASMLTG